MRGRSQNQPLTCLLQTSLDTTIEKALDTKAETGTNLLLSFPRLSLGQNCWNLLTTRQPEWFVSARRLYQATAAQVKEFSSLSWLSLIGANCQEASVEPATCAMRSLRTYHDKNEGDETHLKQFHPRYGLR